MVNICLPRAKLDIPCHGFYSIFYVSIHAIFTMKRHGQGRKIRGHNIQLWPLMMIYVCGVWRPSESPMPVIYQHIFAFPLINSHNLSLPCTTWSGWALSCRPFYIELVMKQYHKMAFKGSLISLKNAWKTPNFRPFATINFKINFGHDRAWIYREQVSTVTLPSFGWNHKVTGDAQCRGKPGAEAARIKDWGMKNGQWPILGLGSKFRGKLRSGPRFRSDDISVLLSRAKKCRNSPYFMTGTCAHIYEVYILLFPRPVFYMFT